MYLRGNSIGTDDRQRTTEDGQRTTDDTLLIFLSIRAEELLLKHEDDE